MEEQREVMEDEITRLEKELVSHEEEILALKPIACNRGKGAQKRQEEQ